jgi:hypothetical protein
MKSLHTCWASNAHYRAQRYVRFGDPFDPFPMTVIGKAKKYLLPRAMKEELAPVEQRTAQLLVGGRLRAAKRLQLRALFPDMRIEVPLAIPMGAPKCPNTTEPEDAGKYSATPSLWEGYERELS